MQKTFPTDSIVAIRKRQLEGLRFMEVIWQGEAGDTSQTALRLIMNNDGLIMFQWRLARMDRFG
jgi:hypothetical protein